MKKLWRKLTTVITDNFFAEQFRFLALAPFLFACGIAGYFALPSEPSVWLSLGIFELWLILFYVCRYKNLYYLFIGGLIMLCGFLNIQARSLYQLNQIEKISEQRLTYLRGQIRDISISQHGKLRLLLDHTSDYDNQMKGQYRITLSSRPSEAITIGQCVEMAATLFPNRSLPILNGFKLDRKYFYEGLSAVGFANSEVFVIDCPNKQKTGFIADINNLRQLIINYIGHVLPSQQAGVADALLVGEKTHILPQITDNYRNSGLAHFLSVSGLHLGSIAALVFFIVRFLVALFPFIALRVDSKKIAALIAIIFSALYLLISGMAIPAQRAFIMTTIVLVGVIFNRQAISMRMVCLAALIILIMEPQTLVSVSFQMSFAAVYALVAFYETYNTKLSAYAPRRGILSKFLWYLCTIVLADLIASLATLPLALYHFHRVAVYTSLGNLLAGPLIGFWLMPAVLLCLLTIPLHLAYYPLKILGFGIEILNHITDYVSHLPHSVWLSDALPFWGLILIIIGAYWLCIWQQPWRKWSILLLIIGLSTILFPSKYPDMMFTDNLEGIALRNRYNNMVQLPYKQNKWLENIWRENLQFDNMDKEEQKKFKQFLKKKGKTNFDSLNLLCHNDSCIYNNRIEFSRGKTLNIDHKSINFTTGGYIYLDKDISVKYFYNTSSCRIWQSCYKK